MATISILYGAARAHEVLQHLRPEDSFEFNCFPDPKKAFRDALNNSSLVGCWLIDDRVACVGGVREATNLFDPAALWLVTTGLVDKHPVAFARGSQEVIARILQEFGPVCGWCLEGNTRSQRWLRWLGFTLTGPFDLEPVGPSYYFERTA